MATVIRRTARIFSNVIALAYTMPHTYKNRRGYYNREQRHMDICTKNYLYNLFKKTSFAYPVCLNKEGTVSKIDISRINNLAPYKRKCRRVKHGVDYFTLFPCNIFRAYERSHSSIKTFKDVNIEEFERSEKLGATYNVIVDTYKKQYTIAISKNDNWFDLERRILVYDEDTKCLEWYWICKRKDSVSKSSILIPDKILCSSSDESEKVLDDNISSEIIVPAKKVIRRR